MAGFSFRSVFVAITALLFASVPFCRAEYYSFNVPSGSDILCQEVRWPFWAESTYNAVWTNDLITADPKSKTKVYFYGGVPEANAENPQEHPANIIWSFWPVSHPIHPGETVKVAWSNPQMYAPLSIGEGASGKASGQWPQIKTQQWYRFVMRVWQPAKNPDGHAFVDQWMRDPADGRWYHVATMEAPFPASGTSGLSGFIEDFSHGNKKPRRTEFRNVYYHQPGSQWSAAKEFTPSVRQHGEKGTVDLIENGTAAFYETCSGPDYSGNLDFDHHIEKKTVTLQQPDQPTFDKPAIDSVKAVRSGKQLLVSWTVPPTASPQFGWKIESINAGGTATLLMEGRDPEARQCLIDAPSLAKSETIRVTLADIFNQTIASDAVTPTAADCKSATAANGTRPGLDFTYVQAADENADWNDFPKFADLKPTLSGVVNDLDLTVRRRRTKYAVDYAGFIKVPTDGLYTFRLDSYDGSKIAIDGTTVVDNGGVHSYTDKSGWVAMSAGMHPIDVEYFRDTNRGEHCEYADRFNLSWAGPGFDRQPVPAKAFSRKSGSSDASLTLETPNAAGEISNTNVHLGVNLTGSPATPSRVAYYVDDMLWAEKTAAPWSDVVTLPKAAMELRARLFSSDGRSFDSPAVELKTRQSPTPPWQVVQIGTPPPRRPMGAAVDHGTIDLAGDGNCIASREVNGNATIIAHVAQRPDANHGTQEDGTTPDGDWMGGVLFRSDLTAHDTFLGDDFCATYARADHSTHLQCPSDHNGGGPVSGPDLGDFDWIKLTRKGSTFTASFSKDGSSWTDAGTRTVDLPARLYAGVFIFSTANFNPQMNGWKFDHVSIVNDR